MLLLRNMKVLFVLAAWIWGIAAVGAAASDNIEPKYETTALRYTTITLATDDTLTTGRYATFLGQVRNQLASGQSSFGIRVTRAPSTVTAANRFILLKLANSNTKFITLAMDVVNAYIVGYQAGTRAYFLKDIPTESNDLFPDIKGNSRVMLTFSGSYTDLGRVAQAGRSNTQLGLTPLKKAVTDMYSWVSGSQQKMASGFLVCIQMVAEAARIDYIAKLVGVVTGFYPGNDILSYENNWSALSSRIQTANPTTRVFTQSAVTLTDANNQQYTVDRVTTKLQEDLALLLYYSRTSQFLQFVSNQIARVQDLCLRANVGGSVWLEICDGDAIEQQWAIYADGSIRPGQSQDKCLACKYDDTQRSFFEILSCSGSSNQRWVVMNDGAMLNLHNGLVVAVSNSNNNPSLHRIIVWPSIGRPQLTWAA